MNNIKKTPNTSTNGYYAIIIKAEYHDEGGSEYDRTSYGELNPADFAQALPKLRHILTNLIGYNAFYNYVESVTRQHQQVNFYRFCETIGINYELPHSIYSVNDVKIIYVAPDGSSYRVSII